jgi:hypothetical protein
VLTHLTEATSPSNRKRTKLGVGERVTLKVAPGPGNWLVSGGKLSSGTGSTVTLTARANPGKAAVSVKVGTQTAQIEFDVIKPSTAHQDVRTKQHVQNGLPNAGFFADIYIGPDDVNFGNVSWLEEEIGATAHGYWAGANGGQSKAGKGHGPNPNPLACTATVVAGKGTKVAAVDHCWSGFVPGAHGPNWTGDMTHAIPWDYVIGSTKARIAIVPQTVVTAGDGTTTITKATATNTTKLTDPSV